jgi:hypothetical protein
MLHVRAPLLAQESTMDVQVKSIKVPKKAASGKREKFVQLAQSRTVNAIGKLGNKAHYEYDDSDVRKIVSALSKEIDELKARMSAKSGKAEVEFSL